VTLALWPRERTVERLRRSYGALTRGAYRPRAAPRCWPEEETGVIDSGVSACTPNDPLDKGD